MTIKAERIEVAAGTHRLRRRFLKDRSGLAALEFALIAPLMILLFFGVVEGSTALAESRRVTLAVNTLADLAAQETQITAAQTGDLFNGVSQIMGGAPGATIRLVSLIHDPVDDRVEVHWSRDNSGGTPYAAGAHYTGLTDTTLLDAGSSLIVAEVQYAWTPPLTQTIIGPVNFDKTAMRWPRRAPRVQFCIVAGTCTT
jgi:Flp pilus assembly pilin Flp